ncbi:hypothetical protein ABW19_dt0200361 [Dactylella cylindrospora]|nr:hypothetical protein ABW19_dt0200361 [Dactylella cylindrospora]
MQDPSSKGYTGLSSGKRPPQIVKDEDVIDKGQSSGKSTDPTPKEASQTEKPASLDPHIHSQASIPRNKQAQSWNYFSKEVPWNGVRDYLALERTFLGWLRTSGAFAMTAVLFAQISVIVLKDEQIAQSLGLAPDSIYPPSSALPSIHKVAKPVAALTVFMALITIVIGIYRFHRGQMALIDGKAITGGWPIIGLAAMVLAVSCFRPKDGLDSVDPNEHQYLLVIFIITVLSADP